MKKFFKLGKRMMALFIVVLLNINSYAAVGANDGSAFVTKAEFDALVNTFNEQMDSYQSGLNAKIDGAIANYLAGLSSLTQQKVTPIISDSKGVWSVTTTTNSGTKDWVEGMIGFTMQGHVARMDKYEKEKTGALKLDIMQAGRTAFKEHLIEEYNVSGTRYGEYKGYCSSIITTEAYGGDTTTKGSWMGGVMASNPVVLERCYWIEGGVPAGKFMISPTTEQGHWINIDGGACIRETDEVLTENVILTGTSLNFPYFNLNKTSGSNALWCKDANYDSNNLHTKNPSKDNVMGTVKVTGYYFTVNGSGYNTNNFDKTVTTISWEASSGRACKPFLGFTDKVTDWNQIYTTTVDDLVDDMVSKANAHTVTIGAKKHLLITNGMPLLKADKDSVVTVPLKFAKIGNEYKNIDIWLKASAFKADENVKTTTEADIIKAENVENMIASAYSNAITLDAITGNGEGVLKFTMPKDGYVFMKWSVAGNEAAGGGTFYPQTLTVVTDK